MGHEEVASRQTLLERFKGLEALVDACVQHGVQMAHTAADAVAEAQGAQETADAATARLEAVERDVHRLTERVERLRRLSFVHFWGRLRWLLTGRWPD